jgi:hypothetical protein
MLAYAQASVTFSTTGEVPTLLTGPVATQGSRHIGNAALDADFFGSANLSDGVLRASVSATPNVVFLGDPVAQSDAQFRDTLKVVGPGTGLIPI